MTTELWQQAEIDNAVAAVINNPADGVKLGTVQRITKYLDSSYGAQMATFSAHLDMLGVNVYPLFSNGYHSASPTAILDSQWNAVTAKFPASQLLLTFPTARDPPTLSPNVKPSISDSINRCKAAAKWVPTDKDDSLKFWFDIFDRRPDDNSMDVELEKPFGIYTYHRTHCDYGKHSKYKYTVADGCLKEHLDSHAECNCGTLDDAYCYVFIDYDDPYASCYIDA
ncbi:hypothetical protein BBJ29_003005 [Phytophthora kernoviae]|uniref:glucan endo-1,3-beta-D-glucosidase n=1 Tax=Phytophthora kernoviae TaxID=325452 RepID=A0A3F2S275_9STRA|nr:hypothetical protein BBJ29_003005 [Phytophthora kernoviae]RLN68789.1 hypothetical protein BBP00_00000837 [Phytophthora kernoviae]